MIPNDIKQVEKVDFSKREKILIKHFICVFLKNMKTKTVDSDRIHFVIHKLNKMHPELNLTGGWYINGPYYPCIDDMLIEMKLMKECDHQLYGIG